MLTAKLRAAMVALTSRGLLGADCYYSSSSRDKSEGNGNKC